jgi:glucosamine kinase
VQFASGATPSAYAELAPLVFEYAAAKDQIASAIIKEAADAAVCIIERLRVLGSPVVSLIGGLAEPLTPWLPSHIHNILGAPKSDPLDGAILMARQALFSVETLKRAG